jgi:hypothetical protein
LKFTLQRFPAGITSTIGELLVDGEPFTYCLEDLPRPVKVKAETRIPAGTYTVLLTVSPAVATGKLWSPLSSTELPLLVNVPGFDGVRIHAGNTDKDTQGCLLVGDWHGGEFLKNSRKTLEKLCDLMVAAKLMKQPVTIEILDPEDG